MTENPAALCLKGQERRGVFVSVMAAVMAVFFLIFLNRYLNNGQVM